jgi:hypothetical protein
MYAGFGQTEPGAGSNFAGMAARAVAQPGGGWKLSGDKIWIGNSSWAGILVIPIFAWEVTLAIWLIVKGFNPSAIASGSAGTETKQVLIAPSHAA